MSPNKLCLRCSIQQPLTTWAMPNGYWSKAHPLKIQSPSTRTHHRRRLWKALWPVRRTMRRGNNIIKWYRLICTAWMNPLRRYSRSHSCPSPVNECIPPQTPPSPLPIQLPQLSQLKSFLPKINHLLPRISSFISKRVWTSPWRPWTRLYSRIYSQIRQVCCNRQFRKWRSLTWMRNSLK